ncbi:MAG: PQQ-dependent sugar dehydrogenase [Acidimicrobiales bacterium]
MQSATPRRTMMVLGAAATLALAIVLILATSNRRAGAHVNPGDFVDELRVAGMTRVVALEWLPSGEALILAQDGVIWKVNPGTGAKSHYMTLPDIDNAGERGALDLVKDPAFGSNGHIFVYYTTLSDQKLNIGRFTYTGAGANDLNTLTTVWSKVNSSPNTNHVGGSIDIGPDNRIYLAIGDSVQSEVAQQLNSVFGKILRINKNGTAPTSNPFYDGAGPNADEIYAYGVRNPWRGSFDDVTGTYFFGDVGGNDAATAYEEINVLQAGANYGWADCQGPLGPPKNGPNCPSGVTAPIWFYDHDTDGGCCQNASVTGGEVVRGSSLPDDLDGAYVYGDFSMGEVRFLELNPGNTVNHGGLVKANTNFAVWVGQGPDGHIYYLRFGYSNGQGQLRRLRYNPGSNQPPVINSATANPRNGQAPLAVQFSASANDPDGDAISYDWDFGDGASSTQRNPSHTYTSEGTYQAQLRVTAGGDTTIGSIINISLGSAPTATIVRPGDGSSFSAGDSITLEGSATDNGPITNGDYRWDVWLRHGNHQHPILTNEVGRVKTLDVPRTGHGWEGDTSYLIQLTVTDNEDLVDVTTVEIEPNKVPVTVRSEAGFAVTIDGVSVLTPFALDTLRGFRHTISTDTDVCVDGRRWRFDRWSDGNTSATRTYTVPANAAVLVAEFTEIGPCVAECEGVPATVVIGAGEQPTTGDDVILGTAGADVINGAGGNDLICGGDGDDTIQGGAGNDWIFGQAGEDLLRGGIGNDVLDGSTGPDQLLGNDGNDVLFPRGGTDIANGGPGDDLIDGKGGADELRGGLGNDTILGQGGNDRIFGGGNMDTLRGGEGDDFISGSNGNDRAEGGPGDDIVKGAAGGDKLYGDGGDDRLFGESGNDELRGGSNFDVCFGGAGVDRSRSCEAQRAVP